MPTGPEAGVDNGPWWDGRRPKSPRAKSPRSRGKGGGNSQGKAQSKTKGPKGSKDKGAPAEMTQAPTIQALPGAPEAANVPAPKPPSGGSTVSSSSENQLLRAVLAHLATRSDVPADLALLVGQHAHESHRAQGKALHKVVARQQEAKLGLSRVRQDRHAYENAWGQYLGQLTQLLEKQLLERQEALAKYDAAEAAWKDQLEEASTELSKQAAQPVPKESAESVQEISEDEMDTREKQINEAIAEEAKAQQTQQQREQKAAQLLEAMQQMRNALPAKARRHGPRWLQDPAPICIQGARECARKWKRYQDQGSCQACRGSSPWRGPHMSPFGQCGPKGSPDFGPEGRGPARHSVCYEVDFVHELLAALLGAARPVPCRALAVSHLLRLHRRLLQCRTANSLGRSVLFARPPLSLLLSGLRQPVPSAVPREVPC